MKLFEHPDFYQLIISAAEHFRERGLRAAVIEKDYYVTEALRVIAETAGNKVIFKGGTSLSKGWDLIQRFSEDIDLFLDPEAFEPRLGKKGIDRELKRLRDSIDQHIGLTLLPAESHTIGGVGRSDRFAYPQHFDLGGLPASILLESGTASGRQPTAIIALGSYLGEYLETAGVSLGAEDEGRFAMCLLHFRRTFVEKMFAIHSKIELFKRDKRPLGSYARHYYDLFQLASRPEVEEMLHSDEYREIRENYDEISRAHFGRDYLPPEELSFSYSDALFPPTALADVIGKEYTKQCEVLCYGSYPSWDKVQARFVTLRPLL